MWIKFRDDGECRIQWLMDLIGNGGQLTIKMGVWLGYEVYCFMTLMNYIRFDDGVSF